MYTMDLVIYLVEMRYVRLGVIGLIIVTLRFSMVVLFGIVNCICICSWLYTTVVTN